MSWNAPEIDAALKRFEGLYPETIELSLGRIQQALELMGRPQDRLPPVIHVAGTNGKGSTCAYLRAMAEAAGLKVHVFTSPHLVRFNERIRLAGELVTDDALLEWLDRTFDMLGDQQITHFEATTAAAILAFSEVEADYLILEVGLGGRFDATNVIEVPAISVITPVDFDHKHFLGSDLAGIAYEKAGIIKQDRPVVSALQSKVCKDVIHKRAKDLDAPLHRLRIEDIERMPSEVSLAGTHQRYNAALAGLAWRTINDPRVDRCAIWNGAQNAAWPARMQLLSAGPIANLGGGAEVWLDGGHNPHAASAIAELLEQMPGDCILVAALMASKDHEGYFGAFKNVVTAVHTMPNASGHRGADPKELAESARVFFSDVTAHHSLESAIKTAAKQNPARILIGGSLYIAGDVLALNGETPT